jgi:hypothetical protein
MFARNLTAREKKLALIVVIAIASSLLYGFVAEPIFIRWKKREDQIKSKLAYMMKSERLLRKFKALEKEYTNLPSLTGAMESEEREIAKTLEALESISGASDCRIQNVKPRPSKKIGSYREISFEVTAEGAIEASNEMLRVKRFTITSKSGRSRILKGSFLINKIIAN